MIKSIFGRDSLTKNARESLEKLNEIQAAIIESNKEIS
jgi:hypothetical protein